MVNIFVFFIKISFQSKESPLSNPSSFPPLAQPLPIVSIRVLIPPANHKPAFFFSPPKHWKNEQVPPGRQKGQIIPTSNMLLKFNNNIYTDFRTAYRHILIPSYVIGFLAETGQDQHLKWNP